MTFHEAFLAITLAAQAWLVALRLSVHAVVAVLAATFAWMFRKLLPARLAGTGLSRSVSTLVQEARDALGPPEGIWTTQSRPNSAFAAPATEPTPNLKEAENTSTTHSTALPRHVNTSDEDNDAKANEEAHGPWEEPLAAVACGYLSSSSSSPRTEQMPSPWPSPGEPCTPSTHDESLAPPLGARSSDVDVDVEGEGAAPLQSGVAAAKAGLVSSSPSFQHPRWNKDAMREENTLRVSPQGGRVAKMASAFGAFDCSRPRPVGVTAAARDWPPARRRRGSLQP